MKERERGQNYNDIVIIKMMNVRIFRYRYGCLEDNNNNNNNVEKNGERHSKNPSTRFALQLLVLVFLVECCVDIQISWSGREISNFSFTNLLGGVREGGCFNTKRIICIIDTKRRCFCFK